MFSSAALLRDSCSLRCNNYMMYFQSQDRTVEKGTGCTETSFLTIPLALLKRGKMQANWWRARQALPSSYDRNDNILISGAGMWHFLWSVTAVLHSPREPQELNIKGIAWP